MKSNLKISSDKISPITSHLNFFTKQTTKEVPSFSLNLISERILFLCHIIFENDFLDKKIVSRNNSFHIDLYKKSFGSSKTSNVIPLIKKEILSLQKYHLIVLTNKLVNTNPVKINIFENIKYEKGNIIFEFNQKYINYRILNFSSKSSFESLKEIKKITSKHTLKILHWFKKNISLDESRILAIKFSELKELMLGDDKKNTYTNKTLFNQKVLSISLKEINQFTFIGSRLVWQRPIVMRNGKVETLKSIKYLYDIDKILDYEYHFNISSSRKKLSKIDSEAINEYNLTYFNKLSENLRQYIRSKRREKGYLIDESFDPTNFTESDLALINNSNFIDDIANQLEPLESQNYHEEKDVNNNNSKSSDSNNDEDKGTGWII